MRTPSASSTTSSSSLSKAMESVKVVVRCEGHGEGARWWWGVRVVVRV